MKLSTLNNSEVLIKLTADSSSVEVDFIDKKSEIVTSKSISIDELIHSLASGYSFNTGLLPKGIRSFSGTKDYYTVIVEMPARKRKVLVMDYNSEFSEEEDKLLPFPDMVFLIRVNNSIVEMESCRLFALKRPIATYNDRLYRFPLGNVYGKEEYNYKICWNSVRMDPVNEIVEINQVIDKFFNSTFNGDLINDGGICFNSMVAQDFSEFHYHLAELDTFPINTLVETDLTIRDLIEKDLNGDY